MSMLFRDNEPGLRDARLAHGPSAPSATAQPAAATPVSTEQEILNALSMAQGPLRTEQIAARCAHGPAARKLLRPLADAGKIERHALGAGKTHSVCWYLPQFAGTLEAWLATSESHTQRKQEKPRVDWGMKSPRPTPTAPAPSAPVPPVEHDPQFELVISDAGELGLSLGETKLTLTRARFTRLREFIDKSRPLWESA